MTAIPKVPKAELHVHFESVILPSHAKELAKRYNIHLSEDLFGPNETYTWTDFLNFLENYDKISSVLRAPEDFSDVAEKYLVNSANEGVIYSELNVSPDHAKNQGVHYTTLIDAVAAGIDRARAKTGIEARIKVVGVRHLGTHAVEQVFHQMIDNPHPYVVGVELAGDEAGYPAHLFTKAYDMAREAGYGCVAHAGEVTGADSVWKTTKELQVSRIGHGVRSTEDPLLVKMLAQKGIALEVCPTSNVVLRFYDSYKTHPLRKLFDANVKVTLNSDDPYYFGTTIGREYQVAKEHFGFSDSELLTITKTAIESSFAEDALKKQLLAKCV